VERCSVCEKTLAGVLVIKGMDDKDSDKSDIASRLLALIEFIPQTGRTDRATDVLYISPQRPGCKHISSIWIQQVQAGEATVSL